jgi:hypothetical protein
MMKMTGDKMDKQTMERRDFLKRMGSLFLGIIFMPFIRLSRKKKDIAAGSASMREAMHYTSGDNLAG